MSPMPESWWVWNTAPHHYCHDASLFTGLLMEEDLPDCSKDFNVLGKGDIIIYIEDHPKISFFRLKDVFYYQTDKPRNMINLKMLQKEYPKLQMAELEVDGNLVTAIVHADAPETVILEVEVFADEPPSEKRTA